ncbi:uridylate kinase [Planctomicrobium sp. SH668]|uniref:uridylate kinase n=1 Tax=Planctomicrobium sp. SH668 TaxID=3448126 RepID=UPI003F5C7DC7
MEIISSELWDVNSDVVFKIGGSLFDLVDLPQRILKMAENIRGNLWIVTGGGGFADEVRRLDAIHGWDGDVSHRIAIQTMSLSAKMLTIWEPRFMLVHSLEVDSKLERIRVLDVASLPGLDVLPSRWDVTSDSIAAWVAIQLGAELTLCKSADLPEEVGDWERLAETGFVDQYFPQIAPQVKAIRCVNLRSFKWAD